MQNNPKIGLGLAALGRPSYINLGHGQDFAEDHSETAMEQRAHEVLDAAWNAGVRYFDTARSYGLGERFLANWLNNNTDKTAELTISSKWGYTYTANWDLAATVHEVKEHSLEKLTEQWQQSQTLLSEHLDIYLVHSATFESGILDNRAVLEELDNIKQQQHVSVGISVSGTEQAQIIQQAIDIEIGGERLFDVIQATYNPLERSAEQALQTAHDAGVFVIIKEALANGRLTHRNQVAMNDANSYLAPIKQLAEQYQNGIDAIALAAIQQQPFVDIVLSGASTVEQLLANLQAHQIPNDTALFEQLSHIKQSSQDYWSQRSQLAWN